MPTPHVLGIDLSLTSTGLAGPGWTATIKPGATLRGTARMSHVRTVLLDRYLNGLDLVALEGPSYGNQGTGRQAGHHERAGLWWVVRCMLDARGHPVAVVPPATLKRYATGKGNASKADVVLAVGRRFPWFDGGEDEADALVLAAMAADHLGHPLTPMPAAHRAALDAVQWPAVAEVAR
ncbi:hypothetical protein TPA0907_55560 [Micromonospora humidisoli]|uniref:hypothetical protein n=1 Tax=Micromonospora sp. AKA109 TaxID=2733865 RepID=UPI0022C97373|nr:hypothetical protein [Micromonospora sp. AKA109]GHJ11189.1 hypothetical protein TPA0907_55560 [Micromonospora sp. AKA109]